MSTRTGVRALVMVTLCYGALEIVGLLLLLLLLDLYAAKPDIRPESRFLNTPPAFKVPVRGGGSRRNIAFLFGMEKLEWLGYPMVKKIQR